MWSVFNKADLIDDAKRERLHALAPDAHIVSSATGEGVDALRADVESMLVDPDVHVEALLPYTEGSLLAKVRLEALEYRDDGIMLQAFVDERLAARIMDVALHETDAPEHGEGGE